MKPHDELFREMVSEPEAHRDMIRICLPDLAGKIDLDTVTAVDATFTGGKQADLLLSMRERRDGDRRGREHLVYMLVEHKSYHDPLVPTQLFRYMGAIWHQQWELRESDARGPLPVINPDPGVSDYAPARVPSVEAPNRSTAGGNAGNSPHRRENAYPAV